MKNSKSDFSLLSKKQRKDAIDAIINFFEEEREEKIGIIAAENILEIFLDTIGNKIYNKGVDDSVSLIIQRHEQITFDLESLLKKD